MGDARMGQGERIEQGAEEMTFTESGSENSSTPVENVTNMHSDLSRREYAQSTINTGPDSTVEMQLQQLEQFYALEGRTEVRQFLRKYPCIILLLLTTYAKIEKHFPCSPVYLTTSIDYETTLTDDNEELVGFISTDLPPKEAVKRLRQFYKDWWLEASKSVMEKVSLGLG
jgi:hypothetical protein